MNISICWAQSGGQDAFQALNLVTNARTAALGGYNVSLADGDLSLFIQNPALLDSSQAGDFVVMYNPFFADIQALNSQYAFRAGALGPIAIGISYLDYGEFEQTDPTGAASGQFTARDFVMVMGKAHKLGPFTLGVNLKWVHSGIAGFQSNALALDLGGLYRIPQSSVSFGLVLENIGAVLSTDAAEAPSLPTQVTMGLSVKPEGMPIRFSATAHHFTDPESAFFDEDENPNVADVVLKRVALGAEILVSRNVNLLLGYDHNRKRELRLSETGGGAGFSYGFKIRIRNYHFRFSRATYHAAGGTSYISLQTNLKNLQTIF
jgi:hypothetical protein